MRQKAKCLLRAISAHLHIG